MGNQKIIYFQGLSKNTFLLALTSLFADISAEMLYPVLPIFLTQTLSAPASIVGVVQGVSEAAQNIIQGFSGWLADKLRTNKSIALVGYGLSALAKPLIGVSVTWQQVLLGRALDRLASGARSSPRDALIASSVEKPHRGKAFGLEGIGDNLGAVIGPLITILLLFSLSFNLRSIFYLALIPGILAFLLLFLVSENKTQQLPSNDHKLNFKNLPRQYWLYLLAIGLFGVGNSSNAFLILRAQDIGISTQATIFVYALFNLTAAISSFPVGSLSDKLGRRNILIAAFLVFFLTYLGFATSQNIFLISFLFIFYGLYQGTFRTIGKALATDLTPSSMRASGLGLYSSVVGLTGLLAGIIGGQLWVRFSPAATFYYGAFFSLVSCLSLYLLVSGKKLDKI